jgi:hypothetical protein
MRVRKLGVGVCVCVFVRECGGVHGRVCVCVCKSVGVGQKCSLQTELNFIIKIKNYSTLHYIIIDTH